MPLAVPGWQDELLELGIVGSNEVRCAMIVSRLRRFVYLGPPKTASTSLHVWLSQPLLCDREWSPASGDQHGSQIPAEAIEFFTFASIRNPYSRTVSLWRHGLVSGENENPPIPRLDFHEFAVRLPVTTEFYGASLATWLSKARLHALVRVERIESILELPPLAPLKSELEPIPRLNDTPHEKWQSYYDRKLADAVYRHFREDFHTFGYCKESWQAG